MQKTNSSPEAKEAIEKRETMKKRAAKQAAKRELAPDAVPRVLCTVLPHGDGRISMGEHVAGLGEVHFEEGETFDCDLPIAVQHYVRGWVNFEGAKEAVAQFKLEQSRQAAADRASQEALDKLMAQVA
jgi:hypothetical protein